MLHVWRVVERSLGLVLFGLAVLAGTLLAGCSDSETRDLQEYGGAMTGWAARWYEAWGLPPSDGDTILKMAEGLDAIEPPRALVAAHEDYQYSLGRLGLATRVRENLEPGEQARLRRAGRDEVVACVNLQDDRFLARLVSAAYRDACAAESAAQSDLGRREFAWVDAMGTSGCTVKGWPTPGNVVKCR
jgi:hypothetical protein